MILKNLAALCRKNKRILLYYDESHDVQWAGYGGGFYPMYGIPRVTEEQAMILFDVPEDKRRAVHSTEGNFLSKYDLDDSAADNRVTQHQISFGTEEGVLYPVTTSAGIAFYDADAFRPIQDAASKITLCERYTEDGDLYLVAMNGMMVEGVILPTWVNVPCLLNRLAEICGELEAEMAVKKKKEDEV